MEADTYTALCKEVRGLARDLGLATFCDEIDERDGRALLSMVRSCRLFVEPDRADQPAHPAAITVGSVM